MPSRTRNPSRNRRTVRVARWSATHPWRAVALWLVFIGACIAIGNLGGLNEQGDLDGTVGQSGRAAHWIHDAGLEARATENVLVTSRHGDLDIQEARDAVAEATSRMSRLPQVVHVGPALTSADRTAITAQITLEHDADVGSLLTVTGDVQKAFPQLDVAEVGSKSLNDAVNEQVASDLGAAATFSLPVTLIILLVAFGAIIAAGVPILLAMSAVGAATGLSALVSHLIPDSGSTSSMILLMGMAVGVDYSLFYVKRARAERHAGRSRLDAIEIAAETSGHSVLVSGAAVIVSMLGLFLAADVTFASLAAGSIVVVAIAVLGSLTVLPALLMLLGKRIDRPRVPVLWRWTMYDREPRLWRAILRPSLNRPGRTLTISVLALVAVALPALGLTLVSDSARSLPDSITAKQTFDRLVAAFPDQQSSTDIVVRAPENQTGSVQHRLTALRDRLEHDPSFVGNGRLRVSPDGTVHVLTVNEPFDSESSQARAGVTALRGGLVADSVDGITGAEWAVGGDTASNMDYDTHSSDRLPWVIAFVIALTMLIMGWVFRSVIIAVATALVNLLSAAASFGVLVLVFQHSWAEGILGFHSTGAVINWIPLFTFAVLFGLSMDYHVFVLGHVREAVDRGLSPRDAVCEGILRSAGTVTSAAIVMVSVFAIFASLHMVEMKELGVGLAVAVLVDALVVRGVVLPSMLVLVGRKAFPQRRHASAEMPVEQPALAGVTPR